MTAATATPETPQYRCLQQTPRHLEALLSLATPDQLLWKPAPERWSIGEILAHLTDVERRNLGLRVKLMLEEDEPRFQDYDQNEEFRKGTYRVTDAAEALSEFTRVREESLDWLVRCDLASWQRTGAHPDVGTVRIEQVLNLWAFHDLGHLKQMSELLRVLCFWEGIGSLQKYYRVNP